MGSGVGMETLLSLTEGYAEKPGDLLRMALLACTPKPCLPTQQRHGPSQRVRRRIYRRPVLSFLLEDLPRERPVIVKYLTMVGICRMER